MNTQLSLTSLYFSKLAFLFLLVMVIPLHPIQSWEYTAYVRGWGGIGFLSDQINDVDVKYNNPFSCGAALGVIFCPNTRAEIELMYLQGKIKDIRAAHISTGIHGRIRDTAWMFNLIRDFRFKCIKLVPYLGGGFGYSHEHIHISSNAIGRIEDKDKGCAYQGIAGVYYSLCGARYIETRLTLDFRYFIFDKHINTKLITLGLMQLF